LKTLEVLYALYNIWNNVMSTWTSHFGVNQKCQPSLHFRLCTLHIILDTFNSYLHFAFHFIFPSVAYIFFHLAFVYWIISALITHTAGGRQLGCGRVSDTTVVAAVAVSVLNHKRVLGMYLTLKTWLAVKKKYLLNFWLEFGLRRSMRGYMPRIYAS